MWVTNRERIHRFLEQELLPHWGLSLFRTWLWVKVSCCSGSGLPTEMTFMGWGWGGHIWGAPQWGARMCARGGGRLAVIQSRC